MNLYFCETCNDGKKFSNPQALRSHKAFKHGMITAENPLPNPHADLEADFKNIMEEKERLDMEDKKEQAKKFKPLEVKKHKREVKEPMPQTQTQKEEDFQCGSCGHQFSGRTANCPSCRADMDESAYD